MRASKAPLLGVGLTRDLSCNVEEAGFTSCFEISDGVRGELKGLERINRAWMLIASGVMRAESEEEFLEAVKRVIWSRWADIVRFFSYH